MKKYNIEIDEDERKALELASRQAYEKWKKLKKPTINQKKWIAAIDKLYIFFKNL